MVGAWSSEQILRDSDMRLVALRHGAEEGQKSPVGVGVPYLLDTVDAQGPPFCQFWWWLAALTTAQSRFRLRHGVSEPMHSAQLTAFKARSSHLMLFSPFRKMIRNPHSEGNK